MGLVGQDETRGRIAFRQPAQRLGFGRAVADDPVPPAFKYIANAGDGDRAILRRERPLFDRAVNLAEDNVVDLVSAKPEVSMGALARVSHELNN